jgi:hypothetical protein
LDPMTEVNIPAREKKSTPRGNNRRLQWWCPAPHLRC